MLSMDELDSLFTIDRSGTYDKLTEFQEQPKPDSCQPKSNILYRCNSKLLEKAPDDRKSKLPPQKSQIPKKLNKRLHEAAAEEQKKKMKIVPGKLSDKLRAALGLSKYGIPMHVYRMRYLGYPPGWLRRIEERPSELKFILNDQVESSVNQKQPHSDSGEPCRTVVGYRTDELIEYPGFNTLLNYDPEEDHWRELGMVPMCKEHAIHEFQRSLKAGRPGNGHINGNGAADPVSKSGACRL